MYLWEWMLKSFCRKIYRQKFKIIWVISDIWNCFQIEIELKFYCPPLKAVFWCSEQECSEQHPSFSVNMFWYFKSLFLERGPTAARYGYCINISGTNHRDPSFPVDTSFSKTLVQIVFVPKNHFPLMVTRKFVVPILRSSIFPTVFFQQ